MPFFSACRWAAAAAWVAVAPVVSLAVDTHVWEQSDQSDFLAGTLKHLSVRSDGHVTLSPEFRELDSTTVPYLWAITQDSKGTLYYAGGAPTGASTKVFALRRGSKASTFAELPGLEVHALAVDAQDRVYAAVLPDAKIYRIDEKGKPDLFFDPHCKYIWAMSFDRHGNLFVATGDAGLIYKVAPDGKGTQFANTNETHARSMVLDDQENLIVGTEPGGLVLRITPQGGTFVLFQTRKREVTAVAIHDGLIYATAVGTKPAVVTGPAPVLPTAPSPVSPIGGAHVGTTPPAPAPSVGSLSASITGGSDLYRIQQDGFAEQIWSSGTDIAYALAFDGAGHPLLATGNKGIIYRIDSDQLSTQLLNAPPTQVTAFLQSPTGIIYALTGNVGNLYSIGPGIDPSGSFDSIVLDANEFSFWGKVHLTSSVNGGTIELEARSGNLSNPQHDWSRWTRVPINPQGGQIDAPPARFLQYRLKLTSSPQGRSPELSGVDIPYLPKNIAPRVEQIDIAPANYRQSQTSSLLERSVEPSGSPTSLTLPAVGQHRSSSSLSSSETASAATLQYSKGYFTARWAASDANHDPLLFKVEIRAKNDTHWRLLKDNLSDAHYAFDGAAFPDGDYLLRVTVTDAPGNPPADTLTNSLESDSFTIDNTPPEILVDRSKAGTIRFTAKDALSWIGKVEYSLDGGDWILLEPVNRVTDSQTLTYEVKAAAGQLMTVRVFDDDDNVAVRTINAQ